MLRAFDNASIFDEEPVEELARLLRAAHHAGAKAAAEAIARATCSTLERAKDMGDAWALTLRYLPDGPFEVRCIWQVIYRWDSWFEKPMKGELDFRTAYRVFEKLPRDRQTDSVTQNSEFTVDNLNSLPACGPWQRLEDVEWRVSVSSEPDEKLWLGIEVCFRGKCEGVVARFTARSSSACAPEQWRRDIFAEGVFSKYSFSSIGDFIPKASVQIDKAHTFEGRFELAKKTPRARLLRTLSHHHGAAGDDALDVLRWAAASLSSMDGCDEAKAKECEDVLLQVISCNFSERSAALAKLPAPLLARLLRRDDINTLTEEQTLLALAPWLKAPARTAQEVAEALHGLRWAWLPARLVGRLLAEGGLLAEFAGAEPVKELVEEALSSKGALKRARDNDSELNCPITHDLFQDPVLAADGYTYERSAIQQLIAQGNHRSPMTNMQLAHTNLTANRTVKKLVDAHRAMLEAAGVRKRLRFETSEPPFDRLSDAVS